MPAPTRTPHRKNFFERHRVLTLAVFFCVCFAGMDLLAGTLTIEDDPRSFRASHPYFHHQLLPNRSVTTRWAGRSYPMVTNSLGMRDARVRDVPLRRPASEERRILLLGDSYTEGIGVPYAKTFVGRLQAHFDREQPGRVELLNGAAVSYSPRLYQLRAEYLIERLGLVVDEVVVLIDISDIQDELAYRAFTKSGGHWLDDGMQALDRWRKQHSLVSHAIEVYRLQRSGIDNRFDPSEIADVQQWFQNISEIPASHDPSAERFVWTLNDHIYAAWGKRGVALAERSMDALCQLCARHGLPLTIVVYPAPPQIYAADRDSRQVRIWRAFSERVGARFVDLFPLFIDRGDPQGTYEAFFIDGDTHWNAAGHALVADALWPVLTTRPPIPR